MLSALEMLPAAVVVLDPQKKILFINQAGAQLLGGVSQDWLGKPFPISSEFFSKALTEAASFSVLWKSNPATLFLLQVSTLFPIQSQHVYLNIVERSPDLYSRFLPDTTLTYVNEAYCRHYGKAREELLGSSFLLHHPEENREEILHYIGELSREQPIISRVNQIQLDNGVEHWLQWTNYAILNQNGEVVEIQSVGHEITELIQTRQELTTVRTAMDEIMGSIPDAVISGSAHKPFWIQYHYVSPAVEAITGYKPERFLKNPDFWEEIVYPEDLARLQKFWTERNEDAVGLHEIDYRIVRKDGALRWVRDRQAMRRGEQGMVHFNSILTDITDHRRIQKELEESQAKYQVLTDSVMDIISMHDVQGKLLYVSPSLYRLLGWNEDQLRSNPLFQIFHPEDREKFNAFLKVLRTQQTDLPPIHWRALRADGTYIWIESTLRLVSGKEDTPDRIVGVSRDITDRKNTEELLQEANQKLVQVNNNLRRYNQEANILNQVGTMFQSCRIPHEIYKVVAQYAPLLFPGYPGGLYIFNSMNGLFEISTKWGEDFSGANSFTADQCWALRRGHLYLRMDAPSALRCTHLSDKKVSSGQSYVCIPMMAQGEALGLLSLEKLNADDPESQAHIQQLAQNLTEHISMSLANLRLQETLQMQSIRDSLTGLFNRRYMDVTLKRELERSIRRRSVLSVVMMDIDHFKQYNDEMGHDAGDILLQSMGAYLNSHIRASDVACRYGGEEFLLIFPDTDIKTAQMRSEQIRIGLKEMRVEHHGRFLDPISISMGVAAFPEHGNTSEELLKAVDTAMYSAKNRGRDNVFVAD